MERVHLEENATLTWYISCKENNCSIVVDKYSLNTGGLPFIALITWSATFIHNRYTGNIVDARIASSNVVTVSFVNVTLEDAGTYYLASTDGKVTTANKTLFVWGTYV